MKTFEDTEHPHSDHKTAFPGKVNRRPQELFGSSHAPLQRERSAFETVPRACTYGNQKQNKTKQKMKKKKKKKKITER
jgi:hypothetical protein